MWIFIAKKVNETVNFQCLNINLSLASDRFSRKSSNTISDAASRSLDGKMQKPINPTSTLLDIG